MFADMPSYYFKLMLWMIFFKHFTIEKEEKEFEICLN